MWRNQGRLQCFRRLIRIESTIRPFRSTTDKGLEKKNGFTILEMMIVMLIVALLLLITLPNIQQKEKIIRNKGCEALLEIVNSQIMLYEIDQLETPTSVQELIDFGYLKKGQDTCPDHSKVVIVDGQAVSQ